MTIADAFLVGCLDGLSPPGLAPNRYRITIRTKVLYSSQSCGHLPPSTFPNFISSSSSQSESAPRAVLYLGFTLQISANHIQ